MSLASSGPRAGCPDDDVLAQWVAGGLTQHERDRMHEHLDACATCRDLLAAFAHAFFDVEPEPTPPADPAARYEVVERLGSGGMGVVYRAQDRRLGREVALKLLLRSEPDDEHGARLRAEARAMAAIDHPNVVRVFDVGTWSGRPFVAMELVAGGTLRGWLQAGPREPAEILARFRCAAQGLLAAHRAGLVHRDFKPDNVLVGGGRVCVGDFGMVAYGRMLVRGPVPLEPLGPVTRTGALVGTPVYMAPEQLDGDPIDARADQFAFCVALFEALFDRRPFTGTTAAALRAAQHDGPQWPASPRLPATIVNAIARGLAERPGDRFADMQALIDALAVRPRRRIGRWIPGIAIAAAVLVAGSSGRSVDEAPVAEVDEPSRCASAGMCDEIAAIEAMRDRGELIGALARANVLVAHAGAHDDRATLGKGLFLRASVQDAMGEAEAAETGFRDAFFLAQTVGDSDLALDAAISSARQLGEVQLRFADGLAWIGHGRAILAHHPDSAREASLLEAEAQIHLAQSDAASAVELHRRALALREGAEVPDESMVATSFHNLALAESELGHHDLAAELLGRAFVVGVREHGIAHPFVLTNVLNMATIEERRGHVFAAEHWYRLTIALLERGEGTNDPLLASASYNLAQMAMQSRDPRDAEHHLTRALELWRANLGESHPDVALALVGLGHLALVRDDAEAARARCEQARVIQEARLPPNHPEAISAISCLAIAARYRDAPREAQAHHERLLEIAAPDDLQTRCTSQNGLGLSVYDQGDLAGARAWFERAKQTCARMSGSPSQTILGATENLGLVARDAGDIAAAREHFAEARRIVHDAYGPQSVRAAMVELETARVDIVAGDYDDAARRLRAVIEPLRIGDGTSRAATAAMLLAHVERTCGGPRTAIELEGDVADARAWLTSLRTDRRAIARACRRASRDRRAPDPSSSTAG